MSQYTSVIQMPHSAFKKDKHSYNNWRFAWAREILQNSYDAIRRAIAAGQINRGKITVYIRGREVRVIDNGIGMTRDVLLNVLLALGGTNKSLASGEVGGFGYAKILLYFGQDSYSIRTGNMLVEGEGGAFNLTEVEGDPVEGVTSTVFFESQYVAADVVQRFRELTQYLDPDCPMDIYTDTDICISKLQVGERLSDLSFSQDSSMGHLRFREDAVAPDVRAALHTLVYRIGGLPMMITSREANLNDSLITAVIDQAEGINPLERLTSNRDGFVGMWTDEYYGILTRLVDDRSTLKRGKTFALTLNPSNLYFLDDVSGVTLSALDDTAVDLGYNDYVDDSEQEDGVIRVEGECDFPPNFAISSEYRRYSESAKRGLGYLKTKKSRVLAHTWNETVKFVLAALLYSGETGMTRGLSYKDENGGRTWEDNSCANSFLYQDMPIVTGFVFSPNAEAQLSSNSCRYEVKLNPMLMRDDWMMGDVIDLAIHEVTHLWYSAHNESFIIHCEEIRRRVRRYASEREVIDWVNGQLRNLGLKGRK